MIRSSHKGYSFTEIIFGTIAAAIIAGLIISLATIAHNKGKQVTNATGDAATAKVQEILR